MYNGRRIAKLRKEKKITQQKLADNLDVDPKTVSRYERNTITPSDEVKIMVAKYFNVTLDYFYCLTDDAFPLDKKNFISLPEGYTPEYKNNLLSYMDLLNTKYDLK